MNVIVTGASKGIGRSIAASFAAQGARLFLCARNEMQLYATVAALQEKFPAAVIMGKAIDLSVKENAIAFGNWCLDHAIPDILVNNAGHYLPGNTMDEDPGNLEHMMNTNLYSAYHLTRSLLPAMISKKSGHIFNICSVAALQAYKGGGGYSVSKFALLGLTRNLREELKSYNIKVTAVHPGAVMTDSWGDFDNSQHRIMESGDIAAMILACSQLSMAAVVEDIQLRPQLGDL